MRRLAVLVGVIIALLLAALWLSERNAPTFDTRFDAAQQRIEDMAESIDKDIEANAPGQPADQ